MSQEYYKIISGNAEKQASICIIDTCFSVLQFGAAWLYQLQTISQDVP